MMGWKRLMSAMQTGLSSGIDVWRNGPPDPDMERLKQRYAELELVASGQLFGEYAHMTQWKKDPRVYKGISLLWNHTSRIPNFYGMLVYQGRLSIEPGQGAIPIKPDPSLTKDQVRELMAAIDVLYRRWNWQRAMKMRPRKSATLGDWPTELIDDQERNFVYPRSVWPGYVTDVSFDPVGNVEAYTIQYMTTERREDGSEETYRFKKVVTEASYSFFKDDEPFGYDGAPASYPNPYGFAPMIWDRHIDNGFDDRGQSAFGATVQQLWSLNSLASHARDAQHKNFMAPVVVSGRMSPRKESQINLGLPKFLSQHAEGREEMSAMAEQHQFIEAEAGVGLHQPNIAVGDTLEWIKWMQEGILDSHPEITFFEKLAEQSQVTGPGADKVILPVISLVEDARDGLDPNTVHLFQMAISMCGHRLNNGSWGENTRNGRDAFKPFDLKSYDKGAIAFSIAERPVLAPSQAELIQQVRDTESIQTAWGMEKVGIDKKTGDAILNQRSESRWREMNGGTYRDLMSREASE